MARRSAASTPRSGRVPPARRRRPAIAALAVVWALFAASGGPSVAADVAFVGMHIQGTSPEVAQALGMTEAKGILVRDVALGQPAAAAGFQRGDVILTFAGTEVNTIKALVGVVVKLKVGQTVAATVLRGGKEVSLKLRTGLAPDGWRITKKSFAQMPSVGLTLATLTTKVRQTFGLRWGTTGIVVTLVDETKNKDVDLRRGDVIVQANQQAVWEPKDLARRYAQAKTDGRKKMLLLIEGLQGFRFSLLPVR